MLVELSRFPVHRFSVQSLRAAHDPWRPVQLCRAGVDLQLAQHARELVMGASGPSSSHALFASHPLAEEMAQMAKGPQSG